MSSESSVSSPRLPFSDLSFSQLFQDYTTYNDTIAPFFAGDFRSTSDLKHAAAKTLAVPRDRETLVDVLLDQNQRWGLLERTRENIEQLRDPATVVVITGQQLGLFLSPLYIPYKTLTTLLLADQLRQDLGRPVVPVFWLAGEDHDFDEVAAFALPGDENNSNFLYAPERNGRGPVGRMQLTGDINRILLQIEDHLPQTPNKADLMAFLRDTYQPGVTFQQAFARMLNRIFKDSGLVIASIDDKRLKKLCVPLFQQEIEKYQEISDILQSSSDALDALYHTQVQVNPTNLFMIDDNARYPIDADAERFHLRGNGRIFDRAALTTLIEDQPELFSPNVVLRPIVQDLVFPTLAYIAGPGEIAYYAQYKAIYAWAGLPMPIIYPRASISLIEPAVRKALERYALPLTAFREDADKLFRKYAIEHLELDLDSLFAGPTEQIESAIDTLSQAVRSWEASLQKTAGSTRQTLRKDLDRFKEQIIKAQKRRLGHDRRRFRLVHNHLFPGGGLQERAISPLYFLNQYGLDFFTNLMNEVSLDTTSHQVLHL